MAWNIIPAEERDLDAAERLVNRVFPHEGLQVRLFFWAYRRRRNAFVRFLWRLAGIHDLETFYVAKSPDGKVVGTTGLYSTRADAARARWLSWYVVAPETRGQGLGSALLKHAEQETLARGLGVLRVYTGSHPVMAKAQEVYDHAGYKITRTRKVLASTVIYREKVLRGEVR